MWLTVPSDGARDDEQRQPEPRGQVGHEHAVGDGHEQPARAFDEREVGVSRETREGGFDARDVDGGAFGARCDLGRRRQMEAIGPRESRIERAAGGLEQARAVVAVAGLARLHDRDAQPAPRRRARQRARDPGLADAGVGRGDEQTGSRAAHCDDRVARGGDEPIDLVVA